MLNQLIMKFLQSNFIDYIRIPNATGDRSDIKNKIFGM